MIDCGYSDVDTKQIVISLVGFLVASLLVET